MTDMAEHAARALIRDVRARLKARTASRADHQPVLEAILSLPEREWAGFLEEFTRAFAVLYEREREERRRLEQAHPPLVPTSTVHLPNFPEGVPLPLAEDSGAP